MVGPTSEHRGRASRQPPARRAGGIVKSILLLLVTSLIALPTTISAQRGEMAYCTQLSDLYRRYVQDPTGRRLDAEASIALEDCQKGNTAAAIPVLQKKLRQGGFTLPEEFRP